MAVRISQVPAADALLERDPLALLLGMLLDQQYPMEKAFAAPALLAERLGVDTLDATAIAAADPVELERVFRGPPALHRYPGAMAARAQAVCQVLVTDHDGRADHLWTRAADGADLRARIAGLPGFGDQKTRIFVALLGKQLGVRPAGWREAAGGYGPDGTTSSVADVTGPESLAAVRAYKQRQKAAARAAADRP